MSEPSGRQLEGAAPGPGLPADRSRWFRVRHFFALVYEKAGDDEIFFLAGAIAFNVVVAFAPMVLAVLGIAGTVLSLHSTDPSQTLEHIIVQNLPPLGVDSRQAISTWLDNLIHDAPKLIGISTIVFMWLATRLIGTLRTALRQVFDVHRDRGIIAGKIFDLRMVFVTGLLFTVNVGLTLGLGLLRNAGMNVLGFLGAGQGQISFVEAAWPRVIAFFFLWTTFVLVYRYLPARRTSWRTSLIAATFTAAMSEVLKEVFAWYVGSVADYGSTYGNVAAFIVLVLWIYYTSVVFVLGGEVAQVTAMQRVRRRQKERLR